MDSKLGSYSYSKIVLLFIVQFWESFKFSESHILRV